MRARERDEPVKETEKKSQAAPRRPFAFFFFCLEFGRSRSPPAASSNRVSAASQRNRDTFPLHDREKDRSLAPAEGERASREEKKSSASAISRRRRRRRRFSSFVVAADVFPISYLRQRHRR